VYSEGGANRPGFGARGSASPQVSVAPRVPSGAPQGFEPSRRNGGGVASRPCNGEESREKTSRMGTPGRPRSWICVVNLSRCHEEKWLNGVGFGQTPSVRRKRAESVGNRRVCVTRRRAPPAFLTKKAAMSVYAAYRRE
jgi:hypothetical protein